MNPVSPRLSALIALSFALGSPTAGADSDSRDGLQTVSPEFGRIEILDERMTRLVSPAAQLEILASGFKWSEGPLWLEKQQLLVFSDVPRNIVYSWSEREGKGIYLEPSGYTGQDPREGELGSNCEIPLDT